MSKTSQEIERKWRLRRLPQRVLDGCRPHSIIQSYLVISDDGEVRIRNEDGIYTLTFKGSGTLKRPEENYTLLSRMGYDLFWNNIIGAPIDKVRYKYPVEERTLEFDVHFGFLSGYICVEVEFPNIESAKAFVLPEWVGYALEVTEDKRYKAKNLALKHATVREDLGL
jgi:CYTH domain-containing protein